MNVMITVCNEPQKMTMQRLGKMLFKSLEAKGAKVVLCKDPDKMIIKSNLFDFQVVVACDNHDDKCLSGKVIVKNRRKWESESSTFPFLILPDDEFSSDDGPERALTNGLAILLSRVWGHKKYCRGVFSVRRLCNPLLEGTRIVN